MSSSLDPKIAFDKVSSYLNQSDELRKLDSSYTCQFNESALSGDLRGKLFSATLKVEGHTQGSLVDIQVKLPLALAFASKKVKATLETYLHKTLNG